MMYFLYFMIMYANDNQITITEWAGMGVCLTVVLAVAAVIGIIYRITLKQMMENLDIAK